MGMGGGKAPQPTPQQRQLESQQASLMEQQSAALADQKVQQKQQRAKIMREEGSTAAAEAEIRSDWRRRGALGRGSLVSAPGYGGFLGRDTTGGVSRTYKPPAAGGGGMLSDFVSTQLEREQQIRGLLNLQFSGDGWEYDPDGGIDARSAGSRMWRSHIPYLNRRSSLVPGPGR